MSYSPIDAEKLANYLLQHISHSIPEKILQKAEKFNINLEPLIELILAKRMDGEEIAQLINKECNKKEVLIYNNLIDNFPIIPVGIRDYFKKCM